MAKDVLIKALEASQQNLCSEYDQDCENCSLFCDYETPCPLKEAIKVINDTEIINPDFEDLWEKYEYLHSQYRRYLEENIKLRVDNIDLKDKLRKSMDLNDDWARITDRWKEMCAELREAVK